MSPACTSFIFHHLLAAQMTEMPKHLVKAMNLEIPKHLIIWDRESISIPNNKEAKFLSIFCMVYPN